MNTSRRTTRRLTYKRAEITKGCSATLEILLRHAVVAKEFAKDRKRDVSDSASGDAFHLLSDFLPETTDFAGVICAYSPGRHQPVFLLKEDARKVPVATIAPLSVTEGGRKLYQEFLEGCHYLLVSGNHVILSQSLAVRTSEAEGYLNWFVRECAGVIQPPDAIYLQDQLAPAKEAKIVHARSIEIGSPIRLLPQVASMPGSDESFRVTPEGPLWSALKAIVGTLPEHMSLSKALNRGALDARLVLKLAKGGRLASDVIDNIATATRNCEELDYTIDMGQYGKIKGNEFRLGASITLSSSEGKINQQELFRKMREWLAMLIETKRVHAKA